jgi:hypothetical protein
LKMKPEINTARTNNANVKNSYIQNCVQERYASVKTTDESGVLSSIEIVFVSTLITLID